MSVDIELVKNHSGECVFKARLKEYQKGMIRFLYNVRVVNIQPLKCGSSLIHINTSHKDAYLAMGTLKEICG